MPIEVVSVRVREHPHEERTPSGAVSWTVEERQRCTDQQTKYPTVWANDHHWRANHVIVPGKNDSSIQLDNSSRRLPFCRGILQFWTTTNQQRAESTFEWRGNARNRDRFNELRFTGNQNIPFHSSGFCFLLSLIRIWLSSLSVSLIIRMENFGWVETFFDHGKRLRSPRRMQSRFRGTCTMPYAYWGSECQSERAPAFRRNAFWSCVLDSGRETKVSRWTHKISKSLSKWSPLRGKSCHLARKEWFFCSTGQFFNEIAIFWRNSSILSDESTTIRVNVRLHRKSEKQRQT